MPAESTQPSNWPRWFKEIANGTVYLWRVEGENDVKMVTFNEKDGSMRVGLTKCFYGLASILTYTKGTITEIPASEAEEIMKKGKK